MAKYEIEHPYVAESLHNLAFLLACQGRYGEAETLPLEALGMYERTLRPEYPPVSGVHVGELRRVAARTNSCLRLVISIGNQNVRPTWSTG